MRINFIFVETKKHETRNKKKRIKITKCFNLVIKLYLIIQLYLIQRYNGWKWNAISKETHLNNIKFTPSSLHACG